MSLYCYYFNLIYNYIYFTMILCIISLVCYLRNFWSRLNYFFKNIKQSQQLNTSPGFILNCFVEPEMVMKHALCRRVSVQGRVCPGGCLSSGVSGRGCLPRRCIPACSGADTLPMDRQTLVKT